VGLANALIKRVDAAGGQERDLDDLISASRQLAGRPDLEDAAGPRAVLAQWLWRRWERDPEGHAADLDDCIGAYRAAVDATAEDDPRRTGRLMGLANALIKRVGVRDDPENGLDDLIVVGRKIAARPDLEDVAGPFAVLAQWLQRRWERTKSKSSVDLFACIEAYRAAVKAVAEDDPRRTDFMVKLANALIDRIGEAGEQESDLDDLILVQREVAARPDLEDAARSRAVLAQWLRRRWERDPEGHAADLDDCIEAYRAAVDATADDDPRRTGRLIGLANALLVGSLNGIADVHLTDAIRMAAVVLAADASEENVQGLAPALRYQARLMPHPNREDY
jgi:hypothetical protein